MWSMLPEDTRLLSGPYGGPDATYRTDWSACPDCEGTGIDFIHTCEDDADITPCRVCGGTGVIEVEVEDACDDERGRFDYDD